MVRERIQGGKAGERKEGERAEGEEGKKRKEKGGGRAGRGEARGGCQEAPHEQVGGAPEGAAGSSIPTNLSVTSESNETISDTMKGKYRQLSENHGKPVYEKETKSKTLKVLIYFWDARDGDDMAGWWFGPSVGGDQVWAFHRDIKAKYPPESGWNVPHDGAV